ncbi:MAG: hypothetical protein IJT65_01250 [Eubacterium sp.]|nr:hypothetical protein [Eubacterium sp.]
MKNKMIRIISPMTTVIIALLDLGAIFLLVLAFKSVEHKTSVITVILIIITFTNIIVAIKTTIELFLNGVLFKEKSVEFTGLDKNNTYYYKNIIDVASHKDTKSSLKKNYVERYSSLILTLDDGSVATVELGYTTKRKLNKIENELNKRIKKDG